MNIDLDRFRDTFFEEADEHLETIEAGLLELEHNPDPEVLHSVFRSAHSIKGGAGTFGLDEVTRFTHTLESVLDSMRAGAVQVTPEVTRLLLESLDVLKELISAARSGGGAPEQIDGVLDQLRDALGTSQPGEIGSPAGQAPAGLVSAGYAIEFEPVPDFFHKAQDPQLLLRELSELGRIKSVEVDASKIPPLSEIDPEVCYLAWKVEIEADCGEECLRDVVMFVEDACEFRISVVESEPAGVSVETPAQQLEDDRPFQNRRKSDRRSGSTSDPTSLRVATEKVDALINLVGELVISQAMVNETAENFDLGSLARLREALVDVARNTKEIQDRVMSIRMVPVSTVFSRFPRLVHDLASNLGKDIALEMQGVDTEIDKGLIERLGDPLTHLIRNAVDHGIETAQERRISGKAERATVKLRAFHESGSVIIEVTDDGRGLDKDRIRKKGVAAGLIEERDALTDDEIYSLIFHAGLSTADEVSDVSGRGVGMDVVRRDIEAVSGSVSITSQAGIGSRVRIRLPLTLAILDGLSVKVAEHVYVIPLLSIVESLRPAPEQIHLVLGRREVMTVRGESLPVIRLGNAFNISGATTRPEEGIVVIIEFDGKRFGLLVDELLGQAQIVVKSIESNFRRVDGVMGATILGDGSVALILDVQGLLRLANQSGGPHPPTGTADAVA